MFDTEELKQASRLYWRRRKASAVLEFSMLLALWQLNAAVAFVFTWLWLLSVSFAIHDYYRSLRR